MWRMQNTSPAACSLFNPCFSAPFLIKDALAFEFESRFFPPPLFSHIDILTHSFILPFIFRCSSTISQAWANQRVTGRWQCKSPGRLSLSQEAVVLKYFFVMKRFHAPPKFKYSWKPDNVYFLICSNHCMGFCPLVTGGLFFQSIKSQSF